MQIPSSSLCTSQLNQASADNSDHDNYKAQEDEQIHPICCVGRVNSWYQRPVKPFLHKFCQMYIMGCYCWDLWLLPDWMLVCYMVTALQHIYYCRCTAVMFLKDNRKQIFEISLENGGSRTQTTPVQDCVKYLPKKKENVCSILN